jgi:hypothetical protein
MEDKNCVEIGLDELKIKIIESLSNENVKKLLIYKDIEGNTVDKFYFDNKNSNIETTGFCYLVSLLIYHVNGKSNKWMFKTITDELFIKENGTHYFLLNKESKEILDITANQFKGINIPYEKSKGIPIRFVNKNVRKFAKILNIKL